MYAEIQIKMKALITWIWLWMVTKRYGYCRIYADQIL